MRLDKRSAIVTGAGRGFGEGIATLFAAEGARVACADIDGDSAARVADAIKSAGGEAIGLACDVAVDADVAAMVEASVQAFGSVDIVVNNAGTTHKNQPLLNVDEAAFDRVFAVNVKSIFLSALHTVPVFRKQGHGVMINIASTAGVRPRPGLVWYNATKGAVITATKSMALELAPDKIRVVGVNPVAGDTPLLSSFLPGEDTPEIRRKFVDTIPLGRLSTAADVAKTCLFLASDDAEFLTGVCIEVDGGRCV
ncbi:MAG: glucose 1-dehydrogenase [Gammaproteobacteria bacterium]